MNSEETQITIILILKKQDVQIAGWINTLNIVLVSLINECAMIIDMISQKVSDKMVSKNLIDSSQQVDIQETILSHLNLKGNANQEVINNISKMKDISRINKEEANQHHLVLAVPLNLK